MAEILNSKQIKTVLLLMGSFTFAFLVGEMVHEFGHYLAHRYYDVQGISIHFDPFGGSRILGVKALPLNEMGITTAAGPGLNLVAGLLASLLIWKISPSFFLPLALWGPVALIQEGVNLSLGLLSPGSDARWLAQWGAPPTTLIVLGVAFILAGTGWIGFTLYRKTNFPERNFPSRLILAFFGLGFLMILRAAVSLFQSSQAALENLVPLLFALILATLISGSQSIWRSRKEGEYNAKKILTWGSSLSAFGLGLAILFVQVILP